MANMCITKNSFSRYEDWTTYEYEHDGVKSEITVSVTTTRSNISDDGGGILIKVEGDSFGRCMNIIKRCVDGLSYKACSVYADYDPSCRTRKAELSCSYEDTWSDYTDVLGEEAAFVWKLVSEELKTTAEKPTEKTPW